MIKIKKAAAVGLVASIIMTPNVFAQGSNLIDQYLTNGKLVIDELGQKLENFTVSDLGKAERVVVTKDHTTIIVENSSDEFKQYVNVLQAKIEVEENPYEQDKMKERLAKLVGGVAIIKVGALTEVEMHEKKLRIEDALNATKAAVKEGVVAGGGTALIKAGKKLALNVKNECITDSFIGYNIVLDVLDQPLKQIVANAGEEPTDIITKVRTEESDTFGFNALECIFTDMFETGIIDPVKVTKSALLNAVSISSMLLTTEAAIVKLPEKNKLDLQGLIG